MALLLAEAEYMQNKVPRSLPLSALLLWLELWHILAGTMGGPLFIHALGLP